ncbi:BIRC3-like protein [Mya arenaria]|uniref:BIRC3-like protein n=1 Tax=Mya arenaria TaxID=6604 RepID=A0ABY7G8I7_MYAAR|nr:BIRC3-like protein [Mya arenaria]
MGLPQWSRTDDPWVEHAKYSPKCQHVISNMGIEFINNVKLSFELTSEGELQFHTTTTATTEETTTEETTTTPTTEETTTTATTEETTEETTTATTAAETTTPTETAEQNATLTGKTITQ